MRRARARAAARAGGGPTTRTETSKRADQYKAELRVAHRSVQQLLVVYTVVYMSTEEETTSNGVQMRSASTVLLSLSNC